MREDGPSARRPGDLVPAAGDLRARQQETPAHRGAPRMRAVVAGEARVQLYRQRLTPKRGRHRELVAPERVLERRLGDLLTGGSEFRHPEVRELAPSLR